MAESEVQMTPSDKDVLIAKGKLAGKRALLVNSLVLGEVAESGRRAVVDEIGFLNGALAFADYLEGKWNYVAELMGQIGRDTTVGRAQDTSRDPSEFLAQHFGGSKGK